MKHEHRPLAVIFYITIQSVAFLFAWGNDIISLPILTIVMFAQMVAGFIVFTDSFKE